MRPGVPALLLSLAFVAAACGSSTSSGPASCNDNPWECPSGQDCWPASSSTYACLTSGTGAPGAQCLQVVGTPSCADGLGCFQQAGQSMGTCVPYCDSQHPCASGTTCTEAHLNCPSSPCPGIYVCEP